MIFVIILACLTAEGASGALQAVSSAQLAGFVTNFRATLLEKIAVETNSTVTKADTLKTKVDNECKPKLEAAIANCKLCAKTECQTSPSFTDLIERANPVPYLKVPLDAIGSKISEAYSLIGAKIAPFITSMKNLGSGKGYDFEFRRLRADLDSVYKALKLQNIGEGIIDFGKIIADDFKNFGKSFADIFTGRRRRRRSTASIDPSVRQCMSKCNACTPLLLPTESEIIAAVCGSDITDTNATLSAHMSKIQSVFNHVIDKVNTIVTKLEIDASKMNTNFELTEVYITWYINGAYIRHRAAAPVPFVDMPTPLALEYWANFST